MKNPKHHAIYAKAINQKINPQDADCATVNKFQRNEPMIVRLGFQVIVSTVLLASAVPALADSKSSQFGYDANGRLTTGLYEKTRCILYAYDPNGNRTSQQTVTKDAAPPIWGQVNWGSANFTAGAANAIWGSGTWGCILWTPP
ncbi:RHS repeat domain-containing protein [Rhizobium leguminosarum]|uniref:RHS repeat domain-containing protein n=1 Tax=Rhizobium leguminosarum TaxID=384 RepID=UPI003F9E5AFB